MSDGFELWRGPSLVDGTPIGVVVTHVRGAPLNRKIGDMSQAWILPLNREPLEAVRTGEDRAVCGTCAFRPSLGGGCYVSVAYTAQRVWWAWRQLGSHGPVTALPTDLARKPIRLGAWGDPAAVPLDVWRPLLAAVPAWTGYTHRWRELAGDDRAGWQAVAMASCDSPDDVAEARAAGWRTFRARPPESPLLPGERVCPSAAEAPTHGSVTCADCLLCDGHALARRRRDVAIVVHGSAGGRALRWMDGQRQLELVGAK